MSATFNENQPSSPTYSMTSFGTSEMISSPDLSDLSPLLPPSESPNFEIPSSFSINSPLSPSLTTSSWSILEQSVHMRETLDNGDIYTMSEFSFDNQEENQLEANADEAMSETMTLPDSLTICQTKIFDLEHTVQLLKAQVKEYENSTELQQRENKGLRRRLDDLKSENSILNSIICPSSRELDNDHLVGRKHYQEERENENNKPKKPKVQYGFFVQSPQQEDEKAYEEEKKQEDEWFDILTEKKDDLNENHEMDQLKSKFNLLQIELSSKQDTNLKLKVKELNSKLKYEKANHMNTISTIEILLLKKNKEVEKLNLTIQQKQETIQNQSSLNAELLEVIENLNTKVDNLTSKIDDKNKNQNNKSQNNETQNDTKKKIKSNEDKYDSKYPKEPNNRVKDEPKKDLGMDLSEEDFQKWIDSL